MKWLPLITFTLIIACKHTDNKIDPRVLTVPSFTMQLIDRPGTFNTASIRQGAPIILVFFSPDCKYSHQQTKNIIDNYNALQHLNIYLCSGAPMQKLHEFSDHYHLNRYKNITVGRDMNLFFAEQLKVPGYPWLFIYKSDKQLKRIATGVVDSKFILKMLTG